MRRRAASVFLICAVLLVVGGGRAVAGGPTSVLLVAPGSGQTASLYSGDDDYELLGELLGAFGGGAGATDDPPGADQSAGDGVTVTWLVHDVEVWRVDWVYPNAKGGPWVATRISDLAGGSIWDDEPTWHRVVDGALLENLLSRLDLRPGSARAAGAGAAPAPGLDRPVADAGPAVGDTGTPEATAPRTPSTAASSAPVWAWAIAGLVLGAGLGVLIGRRRLPVVRRPEPRPDVASASAAGPEPGTGDWALDDELASSRGRGSA